MRLKSVFVTQPINETVLSRYVFAVNLKDIKRFKLNKLSALRGVFDLENDLYAL